MCLDAKSGTAVWDVEVFHQPEGVKIHGKNSHASPTPVTDGHWLFVHFGATRYGLPLVDRRQSAVVQSRSCFTPPFMGTAARLCSLTVGGRQLRRG